jgi:hypothetical protein
MKYIAIISLCAASTACATFHGSPAPYDVIISAPAVSVPCKGVAWASPNGSVNLRRIIINGKNCGPVVLGGVK